jgi:hypothetical protein
MSQNGYDWFEQAHQQAADQYWQQQEREQALCEQVLREAREQYRHEEDRVHQLMETARQQAVAQDCREPVQSPEPPTIHYTELQDLPSDSPIREEWKTYRHELPRLLAEGLEGKFALVKSGAIIGIFATLDEGVEAGRQMYSLQPFLVQPIREREPLLRTRGHSLPCHNSIIRLSRAS